MRPVVGLIPLFDDEKNSFWMLPGYMKALEACGALPIMLPLTTDRAELDDALNICDGILLTGGHDVNPKVYGQEASDKCGRPCDERDEMETYVFQKALDENLPVFGICRGIQFMNGYLGGSLYQDLPSEYESQTEHHMTPLPYDKPIHDVTVLENTLLAQIIGGGVHHVNSYHHQAVKKLAPAAEAMAYSEDGLVEALRVKGQKFAVGLQWHPEFSYESSEDSIKVVQAFVNACK